MGLAIELSRLNVEHGTGGPFGAAVFDLSRGTLVAPGINLVVPSNCSIAHAEIVAIVLAHKKLGHYDLGAPGLPSMELVTSCEPCSMCLGAVIWSGVQSVVIGARAKDAERIGFDEGPKVRNWTVQLEDRGIRVQRDVCRRDAQRVLNDYAARKGVIYNAQVGSRQAQEKRSHEQP